MLKYGRLVTIFLGLWFVWIGLWGCATAPAPITERSGDTDFAKLLESVRVKEGLPALSAAVVIDREIYAAAVGTRKVETKNWVTVDDKFIIGSCGKAFTATLAAILVEEGRLRWQTTIRDAFPDLKMLPEYENITIQQLLSHRAGLPKNFIADLDEKRSYTPKSGRLLYLEQAVQNKSINLPEKVMFNSNTGYTLAGVMLEKITGQAFEELMAEKIFRPLNLTTAGYLAQVYISSHKKSAILLATNARTSHKHLFKVAKRINEYYALEASFPLIK